MFRLHEAVTPAEQALGLGALDSLAPDEGMLFRFGSPGVHPIWMKGMRYAIDILWVGADQTVVHVERSVSPETYPTVFGNPAERPAVAVIELPAGTADRHAIGAGAVVTLP